MKEWTKYAAWAIMVPVALVLLFTILGNLVPVAQTQGNQLNNTYRCAQLSDTHAYNGTPATASCVLANSVCKWSRNQTYASTVCASFKDIPLSSLFGGSGFIFFIIMAAAVLMVVFYVLGKRKGGTK